MSVLCSLKNTMPPFTALTTARGVMVAPANWSKTPPSAKCFFCTACQPPSYAPVSVTICASWLSNAEPDAPYCNAISEKLSPPDLNVYFISASSMMRYHGHSSSGSVAPGRSAPSASIRWTARLPSRRCSPDASARAGSGVGTGTGGVTAAIPLVTKGRSEADGTNQDCNYFSFSSIHWIS